MAIVISLILYIILYYKFMKCAPTYKIYCKRYHSMIKNGLSIFTNILLNNNRKLKSDYNKNLI